MSFGPETPDGRPASGRPVARSAATAGGAVSLREGLLEAAAQAVRIVLTGHDPEVAIEQALGVVGTALGVDRLMVYENRPATDSERLLAELRHQWRAPGVAHRTALRQFAYDDHFPRWAAALSIGQPLGGALRDFPPLERMSLETLGVRSLLVVPLFEREAWWGFLECDLSDREHAWSDAEIEAVTMTGSTLISLIERERLREALARTQARYELAAAAARVGVWDWNLDTGEFFIDPALKTMLGFAPRDIPDTLPGWLSLLSAPGRGGFRAALDERPGVAFEWEGNARARAGTEHWLSCRGAVLRDGAGRAFRVVGTATDVTARRQTELRLSEERATFESIFQSSSSGLFLIDVAKRRVVECNRRAVELFEAADRVTLLGAAGPKLVLSPAPGRWLLRAFAKALRGDGWTGELEMVSLRGRPLWCTVWARRLKIGGRDQILVNCGDVTERHRAEDALRQSEETVRLIFERSPNGMLLIDPHDAEVPLRIVDSNDVAARLHGYERRELTGRSVRQIVLPRSDEPPLPEVLERLARSGALTFESVHRRKDGSTFWVESTLSLLQVRGRELLLSVERDLTGTKRAEEERLRAGKLESLGLLAGGIAHDFNNIFTAVLGNMSLLRMDSAIDPTAAEYLEAAEQACLRAKDLAAQLLTFAKGGAPVMKVASLEELVRTTATFCLRGSKAHLELSVQDGLHAVEVDESQFSQVVQNLLINADQAMPDGGRVWVRLENVDPPTDVGARLPARQFVRLSVRDEGRGIPREMLGRIFDPYFTTKAKGSGLGLATVYSIVRNHRGSISVRSEEGQGAEFIVHLPAAERTPPPTGAPGAGLPRGSGRILVMDDEEIIRSMCRRMLPALGFEAECVADGEAAIAAFEQARRIDRPFDAVLLDVTVPGGMGGEKAMLRLLEIDPATRGIVMSGYASSGILSDPRAGGFREGLAKPFTAKQLGDILRRVVEAPAT